MRKRKEAGCRPFANEHHCYIFVFGAVPVDAVCEDGKEASGLCWHRQIGVDLVPNAGPPGAVEHIEKTIVWMGVRAPEVAFAPVKHGHIEARLVWIAGKDGGSIWAIFLPHNLVRQLDGRG